MEVLPPMAARVLDTGKNSHNQAPYTLGKLLAWIDSFQKAK